MRDTLDRLLTGRPPAHAQLLFSFIPAPRAVALSNSKYHQPGNVGVEHASPPSIRHALARCRPRQDSQAFTRQQLTDWGLVNDATDASAYSKDTALRRALFSNLLGLGDCNGKTLLRQLNQFGFAGQAMESKLKVAERRLAVLKQVLDCLQQDGFKMSHPHQIDAMVWAVELRLWLAFRSGKLPAAADALALSAHMFDEMQLPAGESSAIVANCFWDNRNRALGGATWPADGSRSRGVP